MAETSILLCSDGSQILNGLNDYEHIWWIVGDEA